LRRGAFGHHSGELLLASRGADSACRGLGYAVSSGVRVGIFPGPGAREDGARGCDGGHVSEYVFKLPDLGEGTVEAEIVTWHVKAGDSVAEDQVIAEVMTDKAAVEVPSPVSGKVKSTTGEPGDKVKVGAPLIVFDTEAAAKPAGAAASAKNESA